MRVDETIEFAEIDLKEVFSLFSSSTAHELHEIDDPASGHYFERVDLTERVRTLIRKARICH